MIRIFQLSTALLTLLVVAVILPVSAQQSMCVDTSSTSVSEDLFDSGGSTSNYSNNEYCEFRIQPSGRDNISFQFTDFSYASGDILVVYQGATLSSPVLGIFSSFTGTPALQSDYVAGAGTMLFRHGSGPSGTSAGFSGSWTSAVDSVCPSQSAADHFPSVAYNLNTGSVNWTTDWLEIGETDGSSAGIAQVRNTNCSVGQCLRVGDLSNAGSWTSRGVQRGIDLSAVDTATLRFIHRPNYSSGTVTTSVEVSSDGGSNWSQLDSLNLTQSSTTSDIRTYDISAYASTNTRIRFVSNGSSAIGASNIDDVEIIYDESCPAQDPEPVAEWRMDESSWNGTSNEVIDSSPNGLHGTARNQLQTSGTSPAVTGSPGTCRYGEFDGVDDYVSLGDPSELNFTGEVTFMAWIRPDKIDGNRNIIAHGFPDSPQAEDFLRISSNRYQFGHWNGTDNRSSVAIPSGDVGTGKWIHLAGVNDGTTLRLYRNGVEVASTASTIDKFSFSADWAIGARGTGTERFFDGGIDEVRVYSTALSSTQINEMMNATRPCVEPVAEWRMDESSWNGTSNEVIDSSPNGLHGTARNQLQTSGTSPAVTGSPGTCRYGEFDGVDDYVSLGDPPELNFTGEVTFMAWIRPDKADGARNIIAHGFRVSPNAEDYLRIDINRYRFGNWNGTTNIVSAPIPSGDVGTGAWVHLAGVNDGTTLRLYRNGVEVASTASTIDKFSFSADWAIGARGTGTERFFDGGVDEVRVYSTALSSVQINEVMNATRPCVVNALDHFQISHDMSGIYCLDETIQVSALNGSAAAIDDYTGTITLDTQTGTGDWVSTSGAGTLDNGTAGDGIATYTFADTDNGVASFALSYSSGSASINIDAYSGSIRDDDTEGDITFAPSGFILTSTEITSAGTFNNVILSQTAGSDFPVHITAYGTTATDPGCGIIETYTGNKSIGFLGTYNNPGTGTIPLTVNGSGIAMSGSASSQTIDFTNGKALVTTNYSDAGSVSFSASDASGGNTISGSTNNFTVKPANFVFNSVQRSADNFPNPGAVDASGAVFARAGEDFTVNVSAVNAQGQVTPNYGNESSTEGIVLSHMLVEPSGGGSGVLSGTMLMQSGGVFSGTFNWSEVGIISLTAAVGDGNYLGTGNISNNLSHVGRFTPDHFEVSDILSGALQENCSAGGFSYIGETFGYAPGNRPEFNILAKNAAGVTTQNYAGGFAKLLVGGVSVLQVSQDETQKGFDGVAPLLISHTQGSASLSNVTDGIFKYTFGADQFTYMRDGNSLVGNFNSDIRINIDSIVDADSVTDNFPLNGLELSPAAINLRYGRMIINNGFGSELLDLILPIEVQMYDNSIGDFVTNTADTCSTFSLLAMDMIENLDPATLTTSFSALSSGNASMTINAPGEGNRGSVGVTLNAPAWLEYDWGRPAGEANRLEPKATATFGIYEGDDAFIYRREIR